MRTTPFVCLLCLVISNDVHCNRGPLDSTTVKICTGCNQESPLLLNTESITNLEWICDTCVELIAQNFEFDRSADQLLESLPKGVMLLMLNCLFNVTINDISVIYVTAHRCAGGLKKKFDLRSGSQRHRHFVGFFNVPVQAPTRDHPFYTVIPTHRPI